MTKHFIPSAQRDITISDRSFFWKQGVVDNERKPQQVCRRILPVMRETDQTEEKLDISSLDVQSRLVERVLVGHSEGVNRVGSYAICARANSGHFFVVMTL